MKTNRILKVATLLLVALVASGYVIKETKLDEDFAIWVNDGGTPVPGYKIEGTTGASEIGPATGSTQVSHRIDGYSNLFTYGNGTLTLNNRNASNAASIIFGSSGAKNGAIYSSTGYPFAVQDAATNDLGYVSSAGAWTIGSPSGTQTHTINGSLSATGSGSAGVLRFSATDSRIYGTTSDGADNQALGISAGGSTLDTRGARVYLYGNEVATTGGSLFLEAGSGGVQGKVSIATGGNETGKVDSTGAWTFGPSGGLAVGLSHKFQSLGTTTLRLRSATGNEAELQFDINDVMQHRLSLQTTNLRFMDGGANVNGLINSSGEWAIGRNSSNTHTINGTAHMTLGLRVTGGSTMRQLHAARENLTAEGGNGFANFSFPSAVLNTSKTVCVANMVNAGYGGAAISCGMVDTVVCRCRVTGLSSGTVQAMLSEYL